MVAAPLKCGLCVCHACHAPDVCVCVTRAELTEEAVPAVSPYRSKLLLEP